MWKTAIARSKFLNIEGQTSLTTLCPFSGISAKGWASGWELDTDLVFPNLVRKIPRIIISCESNYYASYNNLCKANYHNQRQGVKIVRMKSIQKIIQTSFTVFYGAEIIHFSIESQEFKGIQILRSHTLNSNFAESGISLRLSQAETSHCLSNVHYRKQLFPLLDSTDNHRDAIPFPWEPEKKTKKLLLLVFQVRLRRIYFWLVNQLQHWTTDIQTLWNTAAVALICALNTCQVQS